MSDTDGVSLVNLTQEAYGMAKFNLLEEFSGCDEGELIRVTQNAKCEIEDISITNLEFNEAVLQWFSFEAENFFLDIDQNSKISYILTILLNLVPVK